MKISLEEFTDDARKIINDSQLYALSIGHQTFTPEHIALQLITDSEVCSSQDSYVTVERLLQGIVSQKTMYRRMHPQREEGGFQKLRTKF